MTVSSYSTTASSNTAINGVNISEGMSPSDVNNAIREQLKDVRSVWNDKEWFLLGDGDGTTTFTRASATSITVASDISSTYHVGRRVKVVGSNTGTIFGKIATSSYSSPNTTVTFTFDSGTINSGDTTVSVYVGSVFTNPANPVIDEDNMASDSAILPPSQQSVKAYVDSQITAQDLDFQGDTGGALSIDLDSEVLDIAGGTGIDTSGSGNTLTVAIDSTVTTLTGTQTLTNKTLTTPVISSISNTGTLTLPTSTDTLVGRATTDTLTNKTISGSSNTLSNIANSSLTNSTMSFGGVSLPLGGTDVTPAFDLTDAINYPTSSLSGTITNAQLAGSIAGTKLLDSAITTAKINDSAVTTAKINNDAVTIDKIADSVIVTNAEHSGHTPDDNSFFTTHASDARYFRQDSTETIDSGDTWSSSDSFIATTSAIDARVIDLVDDVGGFFPIANETSFPNANPDVNDGAGTIVSIKAIATTRTPSSGTVTISSGTVGGSTVTITGCGSTVLTAGFGVLVETTTTLNTYSFHRLVPKATEVTAVAGVASEIALLGTADAVSDMNTLGTSANVTAMDNCSGSIANINTVATDIANVNTTASNISGVNSFAERYRISSSAPTTSLDVGDLYFDTTTNILNVYGDSGWQNAGSSVNGTSQRYNYTATSGQTTFTGSDNNGNTLTYDAGYIDVYLNGVKLLNGTDVTVTSGSSVVLASGASTGDIIDIVAYGTFSVASLNADNLDSGTVPDARLSGSYTNITGLTVNGNLSVDGGTIKLDGNYPTGTGNVALGNLALDDGSLSGNYNVAIGNASLSSNTTGVANMSMGASSMLSNTTGNNNIAIGHLCLTSNVSGDSNVAVGREALENNTASNNTAVGYQALEDNTTGVNNVAVGQQTLNANTTASDNTAIGRQALLGNTTGQANTGLGRASLAINTAGSYNTGVGYFALYNNTASNNTAVGYQTMLNNSTGTNNVAMGYQTLRQNTTASNNTAIGNLALHNNTTASFNTAVGYQSLYSNVTGTRNVAVGYNALSLSTANDNTAIGHDALDVTTTGANNTAVGSNSLGSNTSGTGNTAMGKDALDSCTTGNYNTGIGQDALQAVSTASNNTAVGYDALPVTTGSDNTALGFEAGKAVTTGGNNTIIGRRSGHTLTTGTNNTFLGYNSANAITTGSKNTVIGSFNGNSGGLDLRTSSNNIVLADGDGNVRAYHNGTSWVGGNFISDADMYRMSTSEQTASNILETLNDWERIDNSSFTKIGDGVSHSAGVFTFPRTGIYLVRLILGFNSRGSSSAYNGGYISVTENNSTYEEVAFNTDRIESPTNSRASITCESLVDVTDTSNVKVKFQVFTQSSVDVYGNTNQTISSAIFIRLGDT